MLLRLSPATKVSNFRGRYSSVSIHHEHDVAVCAFDELISGRDLRFSVGRVDSKRGKIEWGDVSHDQNCKGVYPSVSLTYVQNEFYVIETHAEGFLYNECYYRVGKVDEERKSIDWGDSHNFCSGAKPRVCANDDGTVIIAHEESHYIVSSSSIRCDVFKINTLNKLLDRKHECEEVSLSGIKPSIAMNRDTVVLASCSGSNLQTVVGTIDESGKIQWNASSHICTTPGGAPIRGRGPTISINSRRYVVESHMSTALRKIHYNYGYIDEERIV